MRKLIKYLRKLSIPEILSLLLLASLPTQFGKHFWPQFTYISQLRIDYLSPTLYLSDIILIILIFSQRKKIYKLIQTFHFKFTHKVIMASSLSFWLITVPIMSVIYSLTKLLIIVIGIYLVVKNIQKFQVSQIASIILCLGLFFQMLLSIYQFKTGHSLNSVAYLIGERQINVNQPYIAKARLFNVVKLRPYGSFSHPNSLSAFAIVTTLLIWYLSRLSKFNQIISYISILFLAIIVVLTQSQNTFIAIVLTIPTLYLYKIRKFAKIVILIPFFFSISIPFCLIFFSGLYKNPSINERVSLYKIIPQYLIKYPLGTGPNQSIRHTPEFLSSSISNMQPIHNSTILLVVELGIPIFILLCFIVYRKIPPQINLQLFMASSFILYTAALDHYWITLIQNQQLMLLTYFLLINKHTPAKI